MVLSLLFPLLVGLFSHFETAMAQTNSKDPLEVQVHLIPEKIKPHQPVKLVVQMALPEGFHAYLDQFKIQVDPQSGFQQGEWSVGPTKKWFDKFSKKEREGIELQGQMVVELIAPAKLKDKNLKFDLTYQACAETFCLFPITQKHSAPLVAEKLQDATPPMMGWDLQNLLKKGLEESLWLAFAIAFFAGLLTSLTPCVYPMIPITLAVLSRGAENRKKSEQLSFSIVYVLGIATTFSILGLAAAQFGFLFGSLLSQIWVLVLVCLILFVMALSLLGLFELNPPAFLMNFATSRNSNRYFGAYISGLFFGIVASPCVGPVLVAILAWVSTTQKPVLGFALLFTFAVGLGMLFILLGLFSKALPKSGMWMVHVKRLMGLVVLGVSVYYGSLIWQQVKMRQMTPIDESQLKQSSLPWIPLTEEALANAKAQGKPVMIDFWALWCEACHKLEQKTFSDPRVQKKAQEFVLLKFDATQVTPETEKWMAKFSILGLPAIIFISANGEWLEKSTLNEYEDVEPFLVRMSEVTSR